MKNLFKYNKCFNKKITKMQKSFKDQIVITMEMDMI